MKHIKKLLLGLVAVNSLVLGLFSLSYVAHAQSVTRGYSSDMLLQKGMIVKLKDDDPNKVEPVKKEQEEKIHGVVINPTDSAVLLGEEDQKVFVASTGPFSVLVSSQNGPIKAGDYVTLSSISGIGMAASDLDKVVIGKAMENFDTNDITKVRSSATIKDSAGNTTEVKIGTIRVDISVGRNPSQRANASLPVVLKGVSETIAGKPVTPARVYVSFFVFVTTSIISGAMLYSAVRSTMVAMGRNPLGKKAIIRSLLQVASVAVLIFIVGLFAVYLLLKL
ncbi:hypothetical protein H6794_00475 [Candidatus Nomurabacteria bacterium]|nr:hypothetical protein [Candidatus Saccharibacteria bacterium]MCB9839317.1 hypothetical protein [Candidatus Nomurabacteria bacterium]